MPFAALWRGIVDPRIGWQGSGLDRVGGQGRLLVAPDYVHVRFWHAGESAVIEAVLGELRDNNYVACRFSGGEAAARRRELRARFLAEVLARLGFSADRRADLVDARLQGVPRPSGEEALGHVGRLLACVPRLDLRLDTEAAVAPYVESFLVEDYGRFA
ncbi:MAG: hypothetical protein HY744_05625 [Deltaproteobacteria bacterium]|nr:hypothetical protein [Deltaproteobacteria bacterium]